jgi:hypothetical protein
MARRSLATYYYTAQALPGPSHSTVFVRRPQDPIDSALELLREKRAKAKLVDPVIEVPKHAGGADA